MQAESSYHVTWTLANVITELCFIISVCCLFLFWESYGEHFAKLYFNKFFYSLALLQCTSTIRSGENCSDNNTPCSFVFFFLFRVPVPCVCEKWQFGCCSHRRYWISTESLFHIAWQGGLYFFFLKYIYILWDLLLWFQYWHCFVLFFRY